MLQAKICKILPGILILTFLVSCQTANPENEAEKSYREESSSNLVTLRPESLANANIKTQSVTLKTLAEELHFTGKVTYNEYRLAQVSSRIAGRVLDIYARLGDKVNKGQALAMIDSPELGEAQATYLKARASLIVAEKAYDRARTLLEGKAISKGEYQKREGEYLLAKAEALAARDRLQLLGVSKEEIARAGENHILNSRTHILSPLSGTVIERHLTMGEVVEPAKPMFSIADLSNLWLIADVPEKDIAKVHQGQSVNISVIPYPDQLFTGKVTYISDTLDPESRTVKLRAEADNPEGILKAEMFARVKVLSEEKKKALAIPVAAVQREGNTEIVFVATEEPNTFEKRPVSLGPEVQGYRPVISGLREGENIVVNGAFTLKSETLKGQMEEE